MGFRPPPADGELVFGVLFAFISMTGVGSPVTIDIFLPPPRRIAVGGGPAKFASSRPISRPRPPGVAGKEIMRASGEEPGK